VSAATSRVTRVPTETTTALEVLRATFGYDGFKGDQEDVINHVVAGGDALVLMPTGGGKSLCYQIPALVRPGVGVVISPLIALMHDQVTALEALGVRAGFPTPPRASTSSGAWSVPPAAASSTCSTWPLND
jgi:ATP-dependent DNA helicase RecQ